MISMEDWVTIQTLKRRDPKLGTRQIAILVGCSRNTVKAALKRDQYQRYETAPGVQCACENCQIYQQNKKNCKSVND